MTSPRPVSPIPPPYPRNVPLLKGALVSISDDPDKTTTVPFQFNPDSLRRSVKPFTVGQGPGDRSAAVRFSGAASETISLTAQIDAFDGLDAGDSDTETNGILPELAALQLLAYPSTRNVTLYESQLKAGTVNVVPPLAPHLVFVWGQQRVLPVRLESMAITEELFNGNLTPISASVALDLRVLTYSDAYPGDTEYKLFYTHQQSMEEMATSLSSSSAQDVIGVDPDTLD
ncbi:MAG: hypothetical protein AAGF23_04280 [Acidobacteriota bacterium]